MSRNRIEDYGPHQDALRLFDLVVADMEGLRKDPRCWRLIGQQVDSADSICANMEEGFGRLSRREFIRFLDISRGSARETLGRYKRLKHWLSSETIAARVEIADRIIARLTKSINTLLANSVSGRGDSVSSVGKSVLGRGDSVSRDRSEIQAPADTRFTTPSSRHAASDTPGCATVREVNVPYGTTAYTDRDTVADEEIEQLLRIDETDTRHPTRDTRHPTPVTRSAPNNTLTGGTGYDH